VRKYLWTSCKLEFCQDIWVKQYLRARLLIGFFVLFSTGFLKKKDYLLERVENKSNIVQFKDLIKIILCSSLDLS
jgi:hypothetical protein